MTKTMTTETTETTVMVRTVTIRKTTKAIAAVAAMLLTSHPASAQDTLRDAVRFLMTNQGVQTGDFARDREAADAAA